MVELAKTLCSDLNTLGESVKKYVEDVEFMSTPIVTHFEKEKTFRDAVLSTFLAITTEQPQKIPHIAGLIQVVNTKDQSIGKVIVEFLHQKAQEAVEQAFVKDVEPKSYETGPWNRLKLILRLLSTLSFIINEESITKIHTQLIKLAIDLQSASPERRNPLAEAIYYNTLISIPYLFIYENKNEVLISAVKELLELAEGFKIVESSVTITKPFSEFAHQLYESKELITLILPAIKSFFNNESNQVLNIFVNLRETLSSLLTPTEKHSLPQLSFPALDGFKEISGLDTGLGSVDGMWRTPRFTFEVYLPVNGLVTTPSTDSYIGLLVRDITTDIIEALEFNRKEVARQIITLDLFFKEGLFAEPGLNIDKLRAINDENNQLEDKTQALSTWKIEDVAVETVLSLIYKLPTASQPSVYFYTTLVEACTIASTAIAPVMGRAIRFFYSSLNTLDFELRLRYLDWLSVQLSNFNFSWKWKEWEQDSQVQANSFYHPKISFIRNLISKELRLTSFEKIESTLTEEFHKYLDIRLYNTDELKDYYVSLFGDESKLSNVDLSFGPDSTKFFFLSENLSLSAHSKRLFEAIHNDAGKEEYSKIIGDVREEIKDFANPEKLLISLVFQTVAFVGNRSISHANRYISVTFEILEELVFGPSDTETKEDAEPKPITEEVQQKQDWAIEAILKYWNKVPQNGFLVLDILESYELITPVSKIRFALKDTERINYGLVNVSAIESIFRTLTTAVYSKGGPVKELKFIATELYEILDKTLKFIDTENIELPDINEEYSEQLEYRWKYFTVLGFVKSVLRKYSDEYTGLSSDLKALLNEKVQHKKSVELINGWIEELKEL
jgi:nuclear cap-binding protein subunit 1